MGNDRGISVERSKSKVREQQARAREPGGTSLMLVDLVWWCNAPGLLQHVASDGFKCWLAARTYGGIFEGSCVLGMLLRNPTPTLTTHTYTHGYYNHKGREKATLHRHILPPQVLNDKKGPQRVAIKQTANTISCYDC